MQENKSSDSVKWVESVSLFQNKTQGCRKPTRGVSVWQNPGELDSELNSQNYTWYFLRWTRQQIQNLSSDWHSEANWVPAEEPTSQTLFYTLLSRHSAKTLQGMQTCISFCHVPISGWCDPGCRHPTSIRCCVTSGTSSMQQIWSFSLALPPFLHPKTWKGAPWCPSCCFAMKLKQSLTRWSVQWCSEWRIFLALKKEKGRGLCVGTWKKFKNPCQNPNHLSVKVPKLTSCTSEKQCRNLSIIPGVKAKFLSS